MCSLTIASTHTHTFRTDDCPPPKGRVSLPLLSNTHCVLFNMQLINCYYVPFSPFSTSATNSVIFLFSSAPLLRLPRTSRRIIILIIRHMVGIRSSSSSAFMFCLILLLLCSPFVMKLLLLLSSSGPSSLSVLFNLNLLRTYLSIHPALVQSLLLLLLIHFIHS